MCQLREIWLWKGSYCGLDLGKFYGECFTPLIIFGSCSTMDPTQPDPCTSPHFLIATKIQLKREEEKNRNPSKKLNDRGWVSGCIISTKSFDRDSNQDSTKSSNPIVKRFIIM